MTKNKVIIIQADNYNRMQERLNNLVGQGFKIQGSPFIDPTSLPAMWYCTLIRTGRVKETRALEHGEIRTLG